MARLKSDEKRRAILKAATHEIAAAGLSAPTSRIATRAGVAEGTLFTYFANKQEMLNELYLTLKIEAYQLVNHGFPRDASLEARARHIWSGFLDWSIEFPEKRKVSTQLSLSDLVTAETRDKTAADRGYIDALLAEVESLSAFRGLPRGYAAATMGAMQEAAMDFIAKEPGKRGELIERSFDLFWRAVA